MALTNVEKQRRFRERRKELAERAVTEDDPDKVIVAKLVDAIGIDRLREFAKALPRLMVAEEKRWAPVKTEAYTLGDNERMAPGGKLDWYTPNARWHRVRAQAMVPLSPGVPSPYEADGLQYEIHTKRPDGRFPVRFDSLTGNCSNSGLLNESGRRATYEEGWTNAISIKEAKARAQTHFERLAGLEVAPPEGSCPV